MLPPPAATIGQNWKAGDHSASEITGSLTQGGRHLLVWAGEGEGEGEAQAA